MLAAQAVDNQDMEPDIPDGARSRSKTVLLALERLGILGGGGGTGKSADGEKRRRMCTSITLHVAGANHREEGGSAEQSVNIFRDLLQILDTQHEVTNVRLAFVGPTACGATGASSIEAETALRVGNCRVEVLHLTGLYHEVEFGSAWANPDCVVAFQPGIWGYEFWAPSVRRILTARTQGGMQAPFVVTSYNEEEADDDRGSLEDFGFDASRWSAPGWPLELNPNASNVNRPSSVPGRVCTEQHWWQCLLPYNDNEKPLCAQADGGAAARPGGNKPVRVAVSYSGGKDSTLAMHRVAGMQNHELVALLCFHPPNPEFRAHPIAMLELQAQALGLPLVMLEVDGAAHGGDYRAAYAQCIRSLREPPLEIDVIVTGDMDLVGSMPRNFVTECCEIADCGITCMLPLWHADREAVLAEVLERRIRAVMTCVKAPWFDDSWIGRALDERAVEEMRVIREAKGLDVCGENGEYHTCVLSAPLFRNGSIELLPQEGGFVEELKGAEGQDSRWWALRRPFEARLVLPKVEMR